MPTASLAPTYRAVLAIPGAAYAFAIATVGRLAYGVVGLPLLFTIQSVSNSFRLAGLALGAFGATTLTAPLKSRLMDRLGQPRVLGWLGVLFPLPLFALSLRGSLLVARPAVVVALAVLVGLLAPPLGPAMRFLWSQLAAEPDLKQRAYALDAIVQEVIFTIGPAIAGALVAVGQPDVALTLTAVMALVGTIGLATSSACRSNGATRRTGVRHGLWGPLRVRIFWPLLLALLGVGAGIGAVEIAVAARAAANGVPGTAGLVLACLAVGSALGATVWGRMKHRGRRSTQLVCLIGVAATGATVAAFTPNMEWTAVAIFLAGLGLSPVFIVAYLASDDLVPEDQRTEAATWVNTAHNIGWSGGTAAAGWIVVVAPLQAGFLGGAGILLMAITVVAVGRRLSDGEGSRGRAYHADP